MSLEYSQVLHNICYEMFEEFRGAAGLISHLWACTEPFSPPAFIQVPSLCEDLLSSVDQPLKIARDKVVGKDYLLCDYNRDGDSYR